MAKRNLYYLNELSDYKIASGYPDVRGWKVKDADDRTVGEVDNLLVNKTTNRVVYLDVKVNEELLKENEEPLAIPASEGVHQFINKEGENRLVIPIGLAQLDEEKELVHSTEIRADTFDTTKRFREGALQDPETEIVVYRLYISEVNGADNTDQSEEMYNRREFQYPSRRKAEA